MAEDYSNRADQIDVLLAEPVVVVHQNSSGQISLRTPDGAAWDMSKHVGQSFYASPQPQVPQVPEGWEFRAHSNGIEVEQPDGGGVFVYAPGAKKQNRSIAGDVLWPLARDLIAAAQEEQE